MFNVNQFIFDEHGVQLPVYSWGPYGTEQECDKALLDIVERHTGDDFFQVEEVGAN